MGWDRFYSLPFCGFPLYLLVYLATQKPFSFMWPHLSAASFNEVLFRRFSPLLDQGFTFTLRSLIHLELVNSIVVHVGTLLHQYQLKMLSFLQCIFLASLSSIRWLYCIYSSSTHLFCFRTLPASLYASTIPFLFYGSVIYLEL